ncbi:hypothetical protein SNE40_009820 [Patella caerulea]|uniref:Reverse transcriptase domain-containing protein n=1 Tax=Patella caerulea TaxID=87958 RepID=A0AAN8PSV3_PATCE
MSDEQVLITEEQAGFRHGYSTIDNIFALSSMIQKYLSKKGGKFYCFYVDFSKAYDRVQREKLMYQLINNNIHGRMIVILRSIYRSVQARIRCESQLSDTFTCSAGLRQGCVLSPWLFAIYINELALSMKLSDGTGIFIGQNIEDVLMLLFADDLCLVADTIMELQKRITILETYCDAYDMSVNLEKSKIFVFKNGGHLSKTEKWER